MCAPTEFNLKRLAVLPFREVGLKNDTTQLLSGFTEDLIAGCRTQATDRP